GQVSGDGMESVIDPIAAIPTQDHGGNFMNIPLLNYTGTNFPTDTTRANYVIFNSATVTRTSDRLTFSVVANSNSSLVSPTIEGGRLRLHYTAGMTGTATITIRSTDLQGLTVDSTFTVTVT